MFLYELWEFCGFRWPSGSFLSLFPTNTLRLGWFIRVLPHGWSDNNKKKKNRFFFPLSNLTFLINLVAADHLSDAVIRIRKYYSCSSTAIYSLRGSSCDIRYDLVKQRMWSQLNTFKGVGESSSIPKYHGNAKINDPVVVLEMRKKIHSRCGFIDRVYYLLSLKNYEHKCTISPQNKEKIKTLILKPAVWKLSATLMIRSCYINWHILKTVHFYLQFELLLFF